MEATGSSFSPGSIQVPLEVFDPNQRFSHAETTRPVTTSIESFLISLQFPSEEKDIPFVGTTH